MAAVTVMVLASLAAASAPAAARSRSSQIAQTPHNLSATAAVEDLGWHQIKSTVEVRICIFCHTPHHATSITPLWSREPSNITYTLYQSPTLGVTLLQPRGASKLCLSCHDGTVALGLLRQTGGGYNLDPALQRMPTDLDPRKNPNLGTDLGDDHPISFLYPADPELHDPSTLAASGIKLEQDVYVECTACHNPHDNRNGNFLVVNTDNQHDALCTKCHNKAGWSSPETGHRTGGTRYPEITDQVAADGCVSCHYPHTAPGRVSLLKSAAEEGNCMVSCHKDAPFTVNLDQEFLKPYGHFVKNYVGNHAGNEQLPVIAAKKHVECVDCHNPHQAGWQGAPMNPPSQLTSPPSRAPNVSLALKGVTGVDETATVLVNPAAYEFQICFKCHAGPAADEFVDSRFGTLSVLRPDRIRETFDASLRFATANPSFHPVLTSRVERSGAGRSLLPLFKDTLVRIYCADCHAPHGSEQPHALRAANENSFPATGTDYPLCYSCHDSGFLMNSSQTASLHRKHVLGQHDNGDSRMAPCSVCHDPHGVPAARGATVQNGSHMINFDARFVRSDSQYSFPVSGDPSCTVNPGTASTCHSGNTTRTYPRPL